MPATRIEAGPDDNVLKAVLPANVPQSDFDVED
jgi:hypothetical protein